MNKEATKDVLSETVDVIDETLTTIERIPRANLNGTTKKQGVTILLITATAGAALGAFAAWKLARRRFEVPAPVVEIPKQKQQ